MAGKPGGFIDHLTAAATGAHGIGAHDLAVDNLSPDDRDFATAAGFALWVMKKLPHEGEHFHEQGWRFEVVDMDGRKIDKLLVSEARPVD